MTGQASLDSAPPGAPVVDYYDHNSLAYGKERFDWYRDIRERHGPVVWSPHYGGFWIVLGRKELVEAAKQWQVFSSSGETEVPASDAPGCPMHKQHNGLFLPPRPQAIPLIEDDPPVWKSGARGSIRSSCPARSPSGETASRNWSMPVSTRGSKPAPSISPPISPTSFRSSSRWNLSACRSTISASWRGPTT